MLIILRGMYKKLFIFFNRTQLVRFNLTLFAIMCFATHHFVNFLPSLFLSSLRVMHRPHSLQTTI